MQSDNSIRYPTRRRAIGIMAGAAATLTLGATSRPVRAFVWTGTALGADATLTLCHHDRDEAQAAINACLLEIERLEQEFSLYRHDSALSRLNGDGYLPNPSLDMLALLRAGRRLGDVTGGRFDYTIQPLWRALWLAMGQAPGQTPTARSDYIEAARDVVDYRRVTITPHRIRLGKGQQITLNGIAQGYITDRVAELLMARGWHDVRVGLGETRVSGHNDGGAPWRVGLDGTGVDLNMTSGAVAVSAADALPFRSANDGGGDDHRGNHLINPVTGDSLSAGISIAVRADSATIADGLSTALGFLPTNDWRAILNGAHAHEAWLIAADSVPYNIKTKT